jgi:aspartate aminotransferase
MVKMAGATPVFINTSAKNNFKVTEKELAAKITGKTKCLILNSPSNPTGSVYSEEELKFIAKLAVANNFFVVSDEIYEKLVYGNTKHVSIASLGKDIYDRTITVNGLSKSYSMTGWRIGYAAGPLEVMKSIANLQSHAASNASSISQKAALAAIVGDQRCVEEMRAEFQRRRDYMVERLSSMKAISCIKPEGAFYVLCDISNLKMSSAVCATRLLDEAKVAVIPGEPFGDNSVVRLSFATGMKQIEKGLNRIGEWVKKNG